MIKLHEDELERALAQLHIPDGIKIKTWQEQDFLVIQRLSEVEGWPTSSRRPGEELAGWHNSWPTLVAIADDAVVVPGVTSTLPRISWNF